MNGSGAGGGGSIGTTLLSIAGNLVGSYFGGPIGGAIGGMAGGLIGSLIFNRQKKPMIPDLNLMNSSYGNPIPIIWGTVRLSGTVTWMNTVVIKEHGMGKGAANLTSYSYQQCAAIAFCEGPANLVKLWLDGKLFLDTTNGLGESAPKSSTTNYEFAIRQYPGDEEQVADWQYAQWVTDQGLDGQCPAFRGIAYLLFDNIDLSGWGGRFPQVSATYSTSAEYTTIFTSLAPPASGLANGLDMSVCVDFGRNLAYMLGNDGTIDVYNLATAQLIMSAPACVPGASGICCGVNTKLYAWSGSGPSLTEYGTEGGKVWIINPADLSTDGSIPVGNVGLRQMQAVSAGGKDLLVYECILPAWGQCAGVLNFGSSGSALLPLEANGLDHGVGIAIGASNVQAGTVDIWFINNDVLFGDGTIYIYKYTSQPPTTGFSLSILSGAAIGFNSQPLNPGWFPEAPSLAQVGTLGPADWGLPAGLGASNLGSFLYDAADNTLLITGISYGGHLITVKWDAALWSVIWVQLDTIRSVGPTRNWDISQGSALSCPFAGTQVTVFDTSTGLQTASPIAVADGSRQMAIFPSSSFNSQNNTLVYIDENGSVYIAALFRLSPPEIPVADIITDICGRVGLTPEMIDVSLVSATVWGYAITSAKSAGAALADLCHCFQLDMVESDFILKFVPRGQPAVATITQDDLGSVDPKDGSKYWVPKIAQEQEMPLAITVKYSDPNLDYQPGSAYAKRTALPVPTVFSKRRISIDLPVIATNLEATQIAQKWLYTMWAERDTYQTVLSPKYLGVDPTDNIVVTLDNGSSYTVRIENLDLGADFSIRPILTSEDATVYGGSTTPGATYLVGPQTITQAPFGNLLQFNVPLLQDSDDLGGTASRVYYAVGANAGGWLGGGVYNSLDGVSWSLVNLMAQAANWGHTVNALAMPPSVFATDYVSQLVVTFMPGSVVPSSCSYLDLMNGVNPALVGAEIIQFGMVTDNEDGTYTLSTLVRGRRGTDWAAGGHRAGEAVILLQLGQIGGTRLPLSGINLSETWSLVPTGRFIDQAPARNFTYRGWDMMPYAPVNFSRAMSGADLVASWFRQTRIGGYLMDGIDTVPLNEETEAYNAYVLGTAAAMATFNPTPSLIVHRYWQLALLAAGPGATMYGMAEVQFRTVADVPLAFTVGTPNATDTFAFPADAGAGAAAAADGDPATFWSSANLGAGDPIYWGWDYGAGNNVNVVEVAITAASSDNYNGNPGNLTAPTSFNLQWSDDGLNWTIAQTFTARWTTPGETQRFGPYTRAFLGLTVPSLTYTAAEMATDGFDPETDTLYLAVYQLSGVVGPGFPGIEAIPAF